jgi:poly(beta-D-mannuronate) lyase
MRAKWETFGIALVILFCGDRGLGAVIEQVPGTDSLAIEAEEYNSLLNPDAGNDVQSGSQTGQAESPERIWSDVADLSAFGNAVLQAPPSPHKQLSNSSLQEAIAVFLLRFATNGTFTTYIRVRNGGTPSDGSTDSVWLSSAFDEVDPSNNVSTGQTGGYEWRKPSGGDLDVTPGQVGTIVQFRLGVRENDARVDGFVFSLDSGLSDSELDDILGSAAPPPPANSTNCVANMTELNAAISAALPGDTIFMCNGVWTGADILVDTDGTPGQPITLQASTPGQVLLNGGSRLRIAGDHLIVKGLHFIGGTVADGDHVIQFRNGSGDLANNSRLTECAITSYNPPSSTTNYKWVSVYGLNNRVDHCAFTGMNHEGVTLTVWLGDGAPANHTRIDGNYFADRTPGSGNGFETIRIGTSARSMQDSEAVVESNYFFQCDGEIEIISSKSGGNTYRYNTFEDCEGQLTLRHGNECRVEGNFFLGNGNTESSGVRVIGENHVVINNYFENLRGDGFRAALAMMNGVPGSPLEEYFQVKRALVAFNTFVGCRENFVIGLENSSGTATLPPLDCVIANNIVEGNNFPLIEYVTTPVNMAYEGDIFFGTGLGISQPPGITIVDPQLRLAADGLQRPASPGSPALDGASGSYSNILDDMDGDVRVFGTQDIGSDEVSGSEPVQRPLTAADVGPRWIRPSTLRVVNLSLDGTDAHLQFDDETGFASLYHVQFSADPLPPATWSSALDYAPLDYTGGLFDVSIPLPPESSGYWRVTTD